MAIIIRLCLCFSYIAVLHLISTLAQSHTYIIHMDTSTMPKVFSTQHNWYLSTLSSALDNAQVTTNDNNLNSASSKLIYTYTNVMNGFSANLSPTELEALKTTTGYISSIPDLPATLDTTHSPHFLGLDPHVGTSPLAKFGEDVIIGLVDTGVWPESESFKDEGMTKIPSRWKGQCENNIKCNNKLIGARFFNKGLLAKNSKLAIVANSTRDAEGHGTHTSSTAAGSQVDNASFFGYANGSAKGVASRARIAMYKAVWLDRSFSSDILAAIDSAISDGVDVLSISLGSDDNEHLYNDPIAIATFAAMEKGIFVSTSAGNAGPFPETLHNGIPWVITVAAGTMDREFHGTLALSNGVNISGLSLYPGNFSANQVPIVFMGLCDNLTELVNTHGKIVVCEDKNGTLSYQESNLDTANVTAGVFISSASDLSFFKDRSFAGMIISPRNGEILKAYIKNNSNANASMSFRITALGTKPAPSVDSYSSRGPSNSCPFVLKPDITAPGTSILAAWPPNVPVAVFGLKTLFSNFNFLSGTSMACPHVAGVAALLRGAHPDWSPAAIRSAIMTTSDIFDNTKKLIKDIADYYKPASPLAMGAGHINPNRALNPGLVYDVGVQDYVNLLCAMNFTQQNIVTITRSSSNNCSNPSLDLNYPSFIVSFSGNGSSNESRVTREFQRTVTNVGEGQTTYTASVTPIKGFNVTVVPSNLAFKEKNEKLSYMLRIVGPKVEGFGYLTWTNGRHVVRSPIVFTGPTPSNSIST
ncbi:Subtilisin-like protease SBT1.9, partial [Mucuna pruriens]